MWNFKGKNKETDPFVSTEEGVQAAPLLSTFPTTQRGHFLVPD